MAQKITPWLLLTLVLSLGFGQLLRFEYFGLPIYLHDILVICILSLHGLTRDWRSVLKRTDLYGTLGLKLFLAGLTLGWLYVLAQHSIADLLLSSLYTLRLLAYLALYFLLKRSKLNIPRLIFLFSGLVTLVIGLAQYILLPDMRIFQYLGWDDHLNRLTLPHFDPTFTAAMLALTLLSVPTLSSLLSPLILLTILLTYSRSVWLSLIITGVISLKHNKIILVSSILLLASIFALPRRFGEGTNLLRTYSLASRLESDLAYIQKYQWDLLIGRGFNTLILDSPPSDLPNHASSPNNSYLFLLTTTGLLGLVGWGMFMRSLFQASTHKPLLVFFFIASTFNNVMFYPFSLLWIFLIEARVPTAT